MTQQEQKPESVQNRGLAQPDSRHQAEAIFDDVQHLLLIGVSDRQFEQYLAQKDSAVADAMRLVLAKMSRRITIAPLAAEVSLRLSMAADEMRQLRNEIVDRRQTALNHNQAIKERIDMLIAKRSIKMNDDQYRSFEQSVAVYTMLLNGISRQLTDELVHHDAYLALKEPLEVMILNGDPASSGVVFIENLIKHVKRQVKSIRKDLLVSYSRYGYGFENQMRQLNLIEQYIMQAEKVKVPAEGQTN